jgi:hypothetical protein
LEWVAGSNRNPHPTITPVTPDQIGPEKTVICVGPRIDLAVNVGHYLAPLPRPLREELQFFIGAGQPIIAAPHQTDRGLMILFRNCPDLASVHEYTKAIGQTVFDLPATKTVLKGTCRICGCTMDRACLAGCWWHDDTETLCRQHEVHTA